MDEVSSESIGRHSMSRAKEQAVIVWALASAQYALDHRGIQQEATVLLIESISNFSLNARRALESTSGRSGIKLVQPDGGGFRKLKVR